MRPRLPTRHRGIDPLSRLRRPDDAGPVVPRSVCSGWPLGDGVTTPARKYRILFPSCGVPRRTPLAWNETAYHIGEIHLKVNDSRPMLKIQFRQEPQGCKSRDGL